MGTEIAVWLLTVSIWSESETRVLYTHEFQNLLECMKHAQGQIDQFEGDPKRNHEEYMQATCTPKK